MKVRDSKNPAAADKKVVKFKNIFGMLTHERQMVIIKVIPPQMLDMRAMARAAFQVASKKSSMKFCSYGTQ